jgi:hypothetical protein
LIPNLQESCAGGIAFLNTPSGAAVDVDAAIARICDFLQGDCASAGCAVENTL